MESDCSDTEALTKPQQHHMCHRQNSSKRESKFDDHQKCQSANLSSIRQPIITISSKLTKQEKPEQQQQGNLLDNCQDLQKARVAHLAQLIIYFVTDYIDSSNLLTKTMASAITQFVDEEKQSGAMLKSRRKLKSPIIGGESSSIPQFSPNIATTALFRVVFKPIRKYKLTIVLSPEKIEKSKSLEYLSYLHRIIRRYTCTSQYSERKQQSKIKASRIRYWYWSVTLSKYQTLQDSLQQHLLQQAVELTQQQHSQLQNLSFQYFVPRFFQMFDKKKKTSHHILLDNVSTEYIYRIEKQQVFLEMKLAIIESLLSKYSNHIILLYNEKQFTKQSKKGLGLIADVIELDKVIPDSQNQWKSLAFRLLYSNITAKLSKLQIIDAQIFKQEFNQHEQTFQHMCKSTCSCSIIKAFSESLQFAATIEKCKQIKASILIKTVITCYSEFIDEYRRRISEHKYMDHHHSSLGQSIQHQIICCLKQGKQIMIPIMCPIIKEMLFKFEATQSFYSFCASRPNFISNLEPIIHLSSANIGKYILGIPKKANDEWASNNKCFDYVMLKDNGATYSVTTVDVTIGPPAKKIRGAYNFFKGIREQLALQSCEKKYQLSHIILCKSTNQMQKTFHNVKRREDKETQSFINVFLGDIARVSFSKSAQDMSERKKIGEWQRRWKLEENH